MNGRQWTAEAQALVERRLPDAEVARLTGHPIRTVQEHRRALGYAGPVGRPHQTRRDALLASAAGLDFQTEIYRNCKAT